MGLIEAEGTVAGMINRGAGFDLIEDWINESTDLDRQARAALWLYAWSRQGGSLAAAHLHRDPVLDRAR